MAEVIVVDGDTDPEPEPEHEDRERDLEEEVARLEREKADAEVEKRFADHRVEHEEHDRYDSDRFDGVRTELDAVAEAVAVHTHDIEEQVFAIVEDLLMEIEDDTETAEEEVEVVEPVTPDVTPEEVEKEKKSDKSWWEKLL